MGTVACVFFLLHETQKCSGKPFLASFQVFSRALFFSHPLFATFIYYFFHSHFFFNGHFFCFLSRVLSHRFPNWLYFSQVQLWFFSTPAKKKYRHRHFWQNRDRWFLLYSWANSWALLLTRLVKLLTKRVFTSAHETSFHETSFLGLLTKRVLTKRVLTKRVFSSAHETSAHETSAHEI